MMHRRDLEGIRSGIDGLRHPWIAADDLAEAIQLSKERVREDVFLRAAAKQQRFDFGASLRSRCAERRCEDERRDWRRLVHIDPGVEKELDNGLAAAEYGELQETRGMRCRPKDARCTVRVDAAP